MDGLRPIYWHQGMFLQPQHFQLSDLNHQAQLQPYQDYLQPYFWGVSDLTLHVSTLEQRSCEIDRGDFLFPDGTFVRLPGNAVVKSRSFADEWVDQDKPFTIYLGLRRLSNYEDNVTVVPDLQGLDHVKSRYVSPTNPDESRDIYKKGPVAHIKSLNYVLKIVWEGEKEEMSEYQLIPIAQVIRDGDTIRYASAFSPPVIHIEASPNLKQQVKEIRDEITGRALQLDGYQAPVDAKREFNPNLLRYKLALRTLSRYIPRLFHFTETGHVHPWLVYGLLREMIGEISTFTDQVNVLGETKTGERLLPPYDHVDLGSCFSAAHTLITQMLNEITVGPKYLVEMPHDGTNYTARVPPEFFKEEYDFYLLINTESDFDLHQQSLLTVAKLGSSETVGILAERSLPGVGMIHVPFSPPGLPRRANAHYVRLDIHDEQWLSVSRHQNVALLWTEAPEDAKVELVVLKR